MQTYQYSPAGEHHTHTGYKIVIALLIVVVLALAGAIAQTALPGTILGPALPLGFTFLHGAVRVTVGNPESIGFVNVTGNGSTLNAWVLHGSYKATLRSNVLYNVVIDNGSTGWTCFANPGSIVPSRPDMTQDFTC